MNISLCKAIKLIHKLNCQKRYDLKQWYSIAWRIPRHRIYRIEHINQEDLSYINKVENKLRLKLCVPSLISVKVKFS